MLQLKPKQLEGIQAVDVQQLARCQFSILPSVCPGAEPCLAWVLDYPPPEVEALAGNRGFSRASFSLLR